MHFLLSILFIVPFANAEIVRDFDCATYNGTAYVYQKDATSCENTYPDVVCAALFPADAAEGYPQPGNSSARPLKCYTLSTTTPSTLNSDEKAAAIANCPKSCGYCCKTDAYNCPNALYPRLNCATVTNAQCKSLVWRTIIAQDCPAACGFCNEGGCVDSAPSCANDVSICNAINAQDFVNQYCQKTCGRCPSTTTTNPSVTGSSGGSCTSYIADSSSACAAWAANGFCTNNFYTTAQRRSRCATTCKIC